MRASVFFAFALLAVFANAQLVERFIIDDFSVNQGQNVEVRLSSNVDTTDENLAAFDDSSFSVGSCSGLIGCARDMRIQVFRGDVGRTFRTDIFDSDKFDFRGEWAIATPKGGSTVSFLQYDGPDNTFDLDSNGLRDFDFLDNGLATGLRFAATSDQDTQMFVSMFSPNGGQCDVTANFPTIRGQDYDRDDIDLDIQYSEFDGNCDFADIGAVQIRVPTPDADDAILRQIRALGFPDPSPSPQPSQSRTPAPSQSRTPAPSQTPSRTPSPSGPCIQFCECPSFTCAILYDNQFSNNDVDLDFRPSQLVLDDSDDTAEVIYVTRDDDDGVTVPTVSVPSVTVPSVTVPTVSIPSIGDDDDDDDDDDNVVVPADDDDDDDASGTASSAVAVCASVLFVVIAVMF